MIKKTAMIMATSASLLLAYPGNPGVPACPQGKNPMQTGAKCGKGMPGKKQFRPRIRTADMNSLFLIRRGMPHLQRMIQRYWDHPVFNLSDEQKKSLEEVRSNGMKVMMEARPKIRALKREILAGSQSGVSTEQLKTKVAELGLLEATATMTHLKCIESTKAILTKDQIYFLLAHKSRKMQKPMKAQCHSPKGMMQGNMRGMK